MGCHPFKGRRKGPWCRCRHGRMMTSFSEATEVWVSRREIETSEYATEMEEWRRENPPPHLADWMKGTF